MDLFGRRATLQIDTLQIDGLRMTFDVRRSLGLEPNTLEITIWNLSDDSRKQVQRKDAAIILQAGYEDTQEQIFSGNVRTSSHNRDGTDWTTKVKSGDGETAFRTARVAESFKKGTKRTDIIRSIADATGLPIGNIMDKARQGDISGALVDAAKGLVASGGAVNTLDKEMRNLGYQLSIQDGQLQALAATETTNEQAMLLSPTSGLIGSPEPGDDGVMRVKSLLQPGARPGRKTKVESRAVDGFYRIEKVRHYGDTRGQDWYSDLELKPL